MSTPSAGSGVRMSENMMMPSTPKALQGCRESSTAISGVSERMRNGYLSEYARNSAMYRPACRISHTGVRDTSSPRAHRSRMSWSAFATLLAASEAAGADACARRSARGPRVGVLRSDCCAGAKASARHAARPANMLQ